MQLRSEPVVLAPVLTRTGEPSYRVTGTVRGEQRKAVTQDLTEAQEKQTLWEADRVISGATTRAKFTFLSERQLREAEAGAEIMRDSGYTPMDAVRHFLKNPPKKDKEISIEKALIECLKERSGRISNSQYDNIRLRTTMFAAFLGPKTLIGDITKQSINDWLLSTDNGKKTWNNYRGDVSAFFSWCVEKEWLSKNPVESVKTFSKRELARGIPDRLEISVCRQLMGFLENDAPEWCSYFAITLFAGVRPDVRDGEMKKLSDGVARDGVSSYFSEPCLKISAELAKDRRPRQTDIQPNLAAWLKKYPPTAKSLCPADYDERSIITSRFKISHDVLRHTCISAYVARFKSLAGAATQFGTSETVIRDHYLNRMSFEEALEFYSIFPRGVQGDPWMQVTLAA